MKQVQVEKSWDSVIIMIKQRKMSLKSDLPPLLGCRVKNVAMLKCFICNVLFDHNVLITLLHVILATLPRMSPNVQAKCQTLRVVSDGSGGGESDMLN